MRPLTEADVAWLESRVGKYRWSDEDRRRILADLRAAREPWLAGMWQGPALTAEELVAQLYGGLNDRR
jgi:hypothetical protein